MIVCHCKAVTDREVRRAARAGAERHADVVRACGAGSVCGGCRPAIDEILARESAREGDALGVLQVVPAR